MAQKKAYRVFPYPTIKDLMENIAFPALAVVFAAGVLVMAIWTKDPQAWFFFVLTVIIVSVILRFFGSSVATEIRAYTQQNHFLETSLTASAEVLEKSITQHDNYDSYWLTISFNANTISKGVQQGKLSVEVSESLYQNIADTLVVRYSTLDPRIAILAGEVGSDEVFVVPDQNQETLQPAGQESSEPPQQNKLGLFAVESFMWKGDQFYKLYAQNRWLYGARIASQVGSGLDPEGMEELYDRMDLNSKRFLTQDHYNFIYSPGEVAGYHLDDKKRRYNGARYQGKLILHLPDGKKRAFLISSDLGKGKRNPASRRFLHTVK